MRRSAACQKYWREVIITRGCTHLCGLHIAQTKRFCGVQNRIAALARLPLSAQSIPARRQSGDRRAFSIFFFAGEAEIAEAALQPPR